MRSLGLLTGALFIASWTLAGPAMSAVSSIAPAPAPDLLMEEVSVACEGETASGSCPLRGRHIVRFTLRNAGPTPAAAPTVRLLVDDAPFPSATPAPGIGASTEADVRHSGTIAPGETWTHEIAFLPTDWRERGNPGDHRLTIRADPDGLIVESNEHNNAATARIALAATQADFVMDSIHVPDSLVAGVAGTVSGTIRNGGPIATEASQATLALNGREVARVNVPPIAPGASATVEWPATLPAGGFELRATANAGSPPATDDSAFNNERAATLVFLPDLVVRDLTWTPSSPMPGETIRVRAEIENRGRAGANPTDVHLLIPPSETRVAFIDSLAPAARATAEWQWRPATGAGDIAAVVDVRGEVPESDESNNGLAARVVASPRPDLAIRDLSIEPLAPVEGETTRVRATVRNAGDTHSPQTVASLQVGILPAREAPIPSLPPGGETPISWEWTPASGALTLTVTLDPRGSVLERDETNNARSLAIDVARLPVAPPDPDEEIEETLGGTDPGENLPGGRNPLGGSPNGPPRDDPSSGNPPIPDLAISQVTWTPLSPVSGDAVTLTIHVANAGTAPAAAARVRVTVDGQTLAERPLPALALGGATTLTETWRAAAGTHAIDARVIPGGIDLGAGNNLATISVTVRAPAGSPPNDGERPGNEEGARPPARVVPPVGSAPAPAPVPERLPRESAPAPLKRTLLGGANPGEGDAFVAVPEEETDTSRESSPEDRDAAPSTTEERGVKIERLSLRRAGDGWSVEVRLRNGGADAFPGGRLHLSVDGAADEPIEVPSLAPGASARLASAPRSVEDAKEKHRVALALEAGGETLWSHVQAVETPAARELPGSLVGALAAFGAAAWTRGRRRG